MPFFEYRGQCSSGTAIDGRIEASDHDDAMMQLNGMGLQSIELEAASPPPSKKKLGSDDFIFFNEQLASMAGAGIALDEGLRSLAKEVCGPRLRKVIESVADDVRQGTPLDQALAAHESQLPVMYSRVIRAGMTSGQLSSTLINLSQHLRVAAETRRIVAESLTYPAGVLFIAFGLISFVALVLIPSFRSIFLDFDIELPLMTMAMLDFAEVFPELLVVGGVVVGLLTVAWMAMRGSEAGRRVRESVALRLPLVGGILRTSLVARFLRAAALSVKNGIGLPESVRLAAGATGSASLIAEADRIAERVEQGESAMVACESARLIPSLFGYVTDIAGSRGGLGDALVQLARAYDMRTVHQQSMLRRTMMPLAVLVVGVGVGLCILTLFLPLVSLIESVSCGI
ncbi:MAG: type II secretion system F family protein [Planctomycetes bacterium]|nr:type II secretion system F family protein [Planctomycetota bacterium]